MGYLVSISCPFLLEIKEEKITDGEDLVPLLMTLIHLSLFSAAGHDRHEIWIGCLLSDHPIILDGKWLRISCSGRLFSQF